MNCQDAKDTKERIRLEIDYEILRRVFLEREIKDLLSKYY